MESGELSAKATSEECVKNDEQMYPNTPVKCFQCFKAQHCVVKGKKVSHRIITVFFFILAR